MLLSVAAGYNSPECSEPSPRTQIVTSALMRAGLHFWIPHQQERSSPTSRIIIPHSKVKGAPDSDPSRSSGTQFAAVVVYAAQRAALGAC